MAQALTGTKGAAMTPEQVLAHPPRVLTKDQREAYFRDGYLLLERFVPEDRLAALRSLSETFIEESRSRTASDDRFDLEPDHSAAAPRLRRLNQPVEQHPDYWRFASESCITDLAEDLLGPDVMFHHSKLNFKWAGGGEEVKWHQDIQYWPHTNYSVLTIGVYLEDVDESMGPMGVIPGAHEGELFDLYDGNDCWAGAIADEDLARVPVEKAVYLQGPAGSVTVHHCRMIHGSKPNTNPARSRPLLLNAFSSADALPVTHNPTYSRHNGTIVRGKRTRWIHYDPRPCLMPPDWSGGYSSIFALQQAEEHEGQAAAE